jgi:hypothetical protein
MAFPYAEEDMAIAAMTISFQNMTCPHSAYGAANFSVRGAYVVDDRHAPRYSTDEEMVIGAFERAIADEIAAGPPRYSSAYCEDRFGTFAMDLKSAMTMSYNADGGAFYVTKWTPFNARLIRQMRYMKEIVRHTAHPLSAPIVPLCMASAASSHWHVPAYSKTQVRTLLAYLANWDNALNDGLSCVRVSDTHVTVVPYYQRYC